MCKTRNARLLHMNMVLSNGETGATVRLNSPSIYQTNVESFRESESLLTRVFFSGSTSTISLGVKNQNNHSPLHTCVNIINCTRKCVSFFHFQFHFISIIAFSVIDDKSRHLWRLNNILWSLRNFSQSMSVQKKKDCLTENLPQGVLIYLHLVFVIYGHRHNHLEEQYTKQY